MRTVLQVVTSNPVVGDARVRRCGRTLKEAGYHVVYVGAWPPGSSVAQDGLLEEVDPLDGCPRYVFQPEPSYYDDQLRLI